MSEATTRPSNDGKTWEATITLSAPGEYDPEKQLNGDQIVALKELFSDRSRDGGMLQSLVITELITDMLVKDELDDAKEGKGQWVDDETLELLRNPKVVELMSTTAFLGSNWQQTLLEAISLPGDEWPEGVTPPATFVDPLRRPVIAEHIKGLISENPTIDFSEQLIQLETITGDIPTEIGRLSDG